MSKRSQEPDQSQDDLVTSAPRSTVGSLLTDLLTETRREVADERERLEAQVRAREEAQRAREAREEARRREQAQAVLIAETQRLNRTLAKSLETLDGPPASEPLAAPSRPPAARSALATPTPRPRRPWLGALLIVLGVSLGASGAIALAPAPEPMSLPDVASLTQVTLERGRAEVRAMALETRLADVRSSAQAATLSAARAEATLAEVRTQLDAARSEIAGLQAALESAAANPKKPGRRPNRPTRKPGGLDIDPTKAFGGGK